MIPTPMSEGDWLRPTNLRTIAAQYTDISRLPTLDGTNAQNNNFLSPCWNWTEDHVRALRVIVEHSPFPIDAWMAGLDAESTANHDNVSNQFAFLSLNNPFGVLIPTLEQIEVEWESTYTEDQDLAPVNRRIIGMDILHMILRVLSFSASKTLVGTGYHLQFRSRSFIRYFPMADVPYRWKARVCGAFVLENRRQSEIPVLVCVIDANLAEIVGAMISMVTDNIRALGVGIVEQEAFCINLSRPGTHVTFSAALFSAEYLTTARSSTVLPRGMGLIVKQTRMHDLNEPNDRTEVARYVSGSRDTLHTVKQKLDKFRRL